MLEVQKLGKKFGDKVAVNQIDFEVRDGEILGFLGPNGAGKTTTIKMIVGMLAPDLGSLSMQGMDVLAHRLESKQRMSYVPDNPTFYPNMTAIDYLNFLSDVYGLDKATRQERIAKYAHMFELSDQLGEFVDAFSHGMQQKLALIGALIHEPDLFILDEPMVGLDPKSSFTLKEHMRQRCLEGKSVFFSTHVMEVAEKICDRIVIINHGNIVASGTMEEIRRQAADEGSLEKIFLELTEQ